MKDEVVIIFGYITAYAVLLAAVVIVVICLYIAIMGLIEELLPGKKLIEFDLSKFPPPPKRGKYGLPYSGDAARPPRGKVPPVQREPPFTKKDVFRYFGVPYVVGLDPASNKGDITVESEIFVTAGKIEFKPIKTEKEMKENEKNSHYIVKTNSGNWEKIAADQVKTENGMIKFYRGSEMVAMFSPICVESIVKGQEIETR